MQTIISKDITKYTFKSLNFEGPLDLLCYLIDKNKMDIYDIKITEITEQYIEYLNEMESMNLEITSDFILMASTLLYIKSKKLLPKTDEPNEITEEDLINRITQYKRYKEISIVLRDNLETYNKRAYKLPDVVELPKQKLENFFMPELIPALYKDALEKKETRTNYNIQNIKKIATNDNVTVLSKVKEIFKTLIRKSNFIFNKLFDINKREKVEIVTAFMGVLELSRRNKVIVSQNGLFSDIKVEKLRRTK